MKQVSVVIPVKNEALNIEPLVKRLDITLSKADFDYELIFIDDHSTDDTVKTLTKLERKYPLHVFQKKGAPGKAQSLLEGFSCAKYEHIAMIDGDLQYPPEELPAMLNKLSHQIDIVIANRNEEKVDMVRKFLSWGFRYFFTRLLHNLEHDAQSGMKVFKRSILDKISIRPTPWTFDLEFLLKARDAGFIIESHDIIFEKRKSGEPKIKLSRAVAEIGLSSLKMKFRRKYPVSLSPQEIEDRGEGFTHTRRTFVHHTALGYEEMAFHRLSVEQITTIVTGIFILSLFLLVAWKATLIIIIAVLTTLYFSMLFFDFFMIQKGYFEQPEIDVSLTQLARAKNREWPMYSILCPLYKEWQVLPQFVTAMSKLDYPKDKLQVILLLEEDDRETIEHIQQYAHNLPTFFEVIIVPDSQPKTKPKACNYGLKKSIGEYVVIYDAEDVPDPKQLKKAVLAFEKSDPKIVCIQAKLNFYNPHHNLLTRIFTAEYSLWFDLVLTGMQSTDVPIPLGGTSNHFRVNDLKKLRAWDAFNVTEDADLGMRLVKKGYRTAILDSVTLEEANSHFLNWIRQRSRWIKGYIQTYFVHTRNLSQFNTSRKKHHKYTFQLVMGAKILSTLINPIMWVTTILYFAARTSAGPIIQQFFPAAVLYMGVFCFLFGNFLYLYYYMIGCAKRGHFELVKYAYLVPFYWLSMSYAGWMAVVSLIRAPHYWEKTMHGFHLQDEKAVQQSIDSIGRGLVDRKLINQTG